MSDADGPQYPCANVVFVVELEQDMGRSEVEIVENEERKFLYWRYKASVALVTSMHEGGTAPTTWDCPHSSSLHSDCGGRAAREARCGRQSTTRPQKLDTTEVSQYKKGSVAFPRARSPLTWSWNPVRAGEMQTRAAQCENVSSHVGGASVTDVGRPHSVLCSSPHRPPMCASLSLSLRGDTQLHGDAGKRRWNSSSNLCSKAAASSVASVVPNDGARLPKTTLAPSAGRSSTSLGKGVLPSKSGCCPLETETGITIRRPKALVDDRFGRLNTLQDLLRIELEREAFEDWRVLRDEFVRIGCKQMEGKPLRRTLRYGAGNVEGLVRVTATRFSWEREKRWQERRFQALELCNPRSDKAGLHAVAQQCPPPKTPFKPNERMRGSTRIYMCTGAWK
ncbi:putative ATP-dependent DEAD/H RNA helicase [Trypanosoma conorhini]|uniref:Putative ATP-dependent DEAD/H RNA helicase n=1 Tax=Trypanosoma conorhini TaxID=83891 RepID=A0A422NGU3_9TRYP|nr:putative ATP-dependent DEAD/H RNA helicase [Trypanosoma conorhini]RNF04693.1 putative ATP-dependent DEAD/H RNA helicase [Trypanosoma conorhini]